MNTPARVRRSAFGVLGSVVPGSRFWFFGSRFWFFGSWFWFFGSWFGFFGSWFGFFVLRMRENAATP
jgi:hypothetical protein